MGTGSSRCKRVAPVREVNVTQSDAAAASPTVHSRPFQPRKIHAFLRTARNRAQAQRRSQNCAAEDDDTERGLDKVLADSEDRQKASEKTNPPKKTRSRTYGLCHFKRKSTEEPCQEQQPRVSHQDVNSDAFTDFKKHAHHRPTQQTDCLLEEVPTTEKLMFGSCHSVAVTMPVVLYDGSDEELMDTIEREFS